MRATARIAARIAARRLAASFGLATPRTTKRVHIEESGTPQVAFVHDPRLGTYPTAQAAMRAYVRAMEPSVPEGAPDSFIRRHFEGMVRSKQVRLVRL